MPIVFVHVLNNERREATTLEQYVWFTQNKSMWSLQPLPGSEPPAAAEPAAKPAAPARKPKT
jgi:hypothetical protein